MDIFPANVKIPVMTIKSRSWIIALVFLSALTAQAAGDWKLLIPSKDSSCRSGAQGFEIKGDFDGNGKMDIARLEDNQKTRHVRIAVWMNGSSTPIVLDDRVYQYAANYIDLEKPITVTPHNDSDSKRPPTKVKLNHQAIAFGSCESSKGIFYFDDKEKKFKEVWIAD